MWCMHVGQEVPVLVYTHLMYKPVNNYQRTSVLELCNDVSRNHKLGY